MRSPRTLVCILSQTREHEVVWHNFKVNVLDFLNADLALSIAVPSDYDYDNPYWQHAKYKWTSPEYADWKEAFYCAQGILDADNSWEMLLSIPDNWLAPVNGHRGAGGILIYHRWLLLHKMREEGVLDKYDRFIVTRSDYNYLSPHPPMEYLNPGILWVPDGEHYGSITDRHVVLSRGNVEQYLNILENMMFRPAELYAKLYNWCNLEKAVHQNVGLQLGFDCWCAFPFIMYSLRSEGVATRWAEGHWKPELLHYVKYPGEYDAAMKNAEIFKTREDWSRWYHANFAH